MEREAIWTQIKEAACMSVAKGTLALRILGFLELLRLGMVFLPRRIFQLQSEQPGGVCQAVTLTSNSYPGSWSMAKCHTSSWVPDGNGWPLCPGELN